MRDVRAAVLGILLTLVPLTPVFADSFAPPPPGVAGPQTPPPGSGPILGSPTVTPGGRSLVPPQVQLQRLDRRERILKRRMWRLRVRRQRFLAQGMPYHAHKVHERIIDLGWRLRRLQAAERALGRR